MAHAARKPTKIDRPEKPRPKRLATAESERLRRLAELTEKIGRQLDAQGVTDEMIERDFEAFKKHRRRQ